MLSFKTTNIFSEEFSDFWKVNTINCVGVMGKGIALDFKNKYPKMFDEYKKECQSGKIKIGKCWIYSQDKIICFPTKTNWCLNSRYEYIELGLDDLKNTLLNGVDENCLYSVQQTFDYTNDRIDIRSRRVALPHPGKTYIQKIVIPPLGCGNGGLNFEKVKKIILDKLNDSRLNNFNIIIINPQ